MRSALALALACGACTVTDVEGSGTDGSTGGLDSTSDGASHGVTSQSSVDSTSSATSGASSSGDSVGDFTDDGPFPNDMPLVGVVDCRDEPPAGAQLPPPLPTYDGECPELVPGLNPIDSMGNLREFLLILPSDLDPDERLPVVFLWHWLGGSADAFLEQGDVQNAVDQFRFAAVIPEEKGDLLFRWPFTILDPQPRVDEEYQFFDDMLACVAEQYSIEENCISSAGVSAGALFTSQLASGRGERLASFLSLSGGTGGAVVKPWGGSSHKMPAMVLWGGDMDFCVAVDFNNTSMDLESHLADEGHFVLECIHNCMHSAPPFDMAPGQTAFAPMWQFVLDHPYWLGDGESPYLGGVPELMPQWCGVGPGGATPREGECGPNQC
ncbi:MAG: hypothetical protein KDK70_15990 [Myxococcales bacterium]|nr:hypothetical protein [Myxococcales bacterium]